MLKLFLIEPPISVQEYEIDNETKYTIWLPPLWAIALSAFLKKRMSNIKIEFLDGQLRSFSEIKNQIIKEKPDFVGISPKDKTYQRSLKLARISKQTGAKVVLGGLHADSLAKEIIKNRGPYSSDYCIDLVIRGDGEKALFDYVKGQSLKRINNLVYQGDHEIKESPIIFSSLDNLPALDFGLVNLNDYFQDYQKRYPYLKDRFMLRIYMQKGCLWRKINKKGCIYCSFSGGSIRLRKPKIIWQEINNAIKMYGVNQISDVSDMAFEDKKWLAEFHQLAVKSKYPLPDFSTIIRASFLNDLMIKKLKQSNINYVTVGIESGAQECLNRMNTGTSVISAYKTIASLAKNNIRMTLRFLIGAPGETKSTLDKTTSFAKKLSKFKQVDRMVASQFIPYPNTYAWSMLSSKIGDKYLNNDILDFRQVQIDWQNHFCTVDNEKLGQAANMINQNKNNNEI